MNIIKAIKKNLSYKCPLCGMVCQTFIRDKEELTGYASCKDCLISFTDWENINQKTDGNKDIRDVYFNKDGNNPHTEFGAKHFIPIISDLVQKKPSGCTFLDIGFAHPAVLNEAKKAGYKTMGIDINIHPSDINSLHDIKTGDFEEMEITDKFDVIWASHIFEHFKDPIKMIRKCFDMLNPNGVIYLAMPDLYFVKDLGIRGFPHWNPKEHYILWHREVWEKEMEKAGFQIDISRCNSDNRFSSWHDFQIIAHKKGIICP